MSHKINIEKAGDSIAEWIFTKFIEEGKDPKELYDIELITEDPYRVEVTVKAEYAMEFFKIREVVVSLLDNCIEDEADKES